MEKLQPDFNKMPKDMQEQIVRMHHRMQAWRTQNPKADVMIVWRENVGNVQLIIICTIRQAMKLGFVTTNEPAYEMIRAMCEPEKMEPTLHMVRTAIELNV